MVLPIDVLRKDTFCHFVCKFSQIFIHISIYSNILFFSIRLPENIFSTNLSVNNILLSRSLNELRFQKFTNL